MIGAGRGNFSIMVESRGLGSIMEKAMEMVEPFAIPDVYASGLAEVEDIGGGNYRFVLYALHRSGGREERQVVARIIMCAEAIPEAMRMTARTTCCCACGGVRDGTVH